MYRHHPIAIFDSKHYLCSFLMHIDFVKIYLVFVSHGVPTF